MTEHIEKLGDNTSKEVKPDFESGRGYYWMRATVEGRNHGWGVEPPRVPRRTLAQRSFFEQVDRRLSRSTTIVNIAFDKEGKRIHE